MTKRFLFLFCVLCLASLPAAAQFTTVTGTVKDVNGLAYAGGTISASLVVPGGSSPTLNGVGFTGSMSPIGLDGTGSFTARLADNNVVLPSGTQWKFQVNIAGVPPPLGTGPQTCIATVTITGAAQSISSSFSSCPALSNTGGGGGVVGGTFGASPSSGYTFTSTPITTAPFSGNLLIGANINNNGTGSYSAGTGYTLTAAGTIVLAMEYATATTATNYSSPFTYSVNSGNWGGTIAAFSSPANNAAFVQGRTLNAVTSLAFSSSVGAGHFLVVAFRYNGASAAPISSVTDNVGDTWVSAGARCLEGYSKGASDSNFLEVWYTMNSIGGATTVTATMGSGTTGGATHMAIAEFSGVATSNALVDYNFTGSTTSVTSIPGATTNAQYTINAINNTTGVIDFTGRDSGAVFRSAANARANTGGLFFFKNGIYPGQTSLQESVAGQTNWYIWGIPAPVGSQQVSWHIVCESFTQILYGTLQTDGCIHQVMPSAYAGPQPSSNTLSGFWQRPSVTFGNNSNDADFFVNNTVRIPDNQHTPSNSYDTFTSVYSSHIGTVADTVILATDQQCSGLTAPANNIIGFRTNQSSTDETYFENTWAIGFFQPYSVLSNHPVGINMHAVCGQNAGSLGVATSVYGGLFIHYQDIHNISGLTLNCAQPATRFDLLNTIVEINPVNGPFVRVNGATETTPGNCVGKIDVTTQGAGGGGAIAGGVGAFFNSGNGANFRVNESDRLVQPGILTSSSTSAATTGTTKQTLATYTFPYNSSVNGGAGPFQQNAGAVFRISAWGVTAANADSKTVEIDFGGTAISTITSTVNNGVIRVSADIIAGATSVQECNGYADDGTIHTVTRTSPGITGTATIVTNLAATTGTSAGDFTFKGWAIEYIGGN
jgi:hypothetical protein